MREAESLQPWEVQSSEMVHDYGFFNVRRDRVASPKDGSEKDYYLVDADDGAVVIALTPEREIILVEQFRQPLRMLNLELPTGIIDPGEAPVTAALRELQEETGFRGYNAELIGTLVLNPSWQTTRVSVVLVRDVTERGEKDLDEGEDTRVHVMSFQRLRELIREGRFNSSVAMAALGVFWASEQANI